MHDLMDKLSAALERMIAAQMIAYPSNWSDFDRREMAMFHLKLIPAVTL